MPENITPHELNDLPIDLRRNVHTALHEAVDLLTTALYGTAPSYADLLELPPTARRDHHLARLAAIDTITEELTHQSREHAGAAGRVEGAPATYADIGRAVGLGREGARGRFPGAVPDAKAGRPPRQVSVLFTGGPAEWDGYRMEYPASTLEGPIESIGAHLVVDQVPDGLPADSRAHYAPADGGIRHIWEFKGWV